MKSSIKIDYAGIHEGLDSENKQPLIRIDLQKSDDPRDTLLNELVTPKTIFDFRLKSQNDFSTTYIIYAKSRYHQVSDIASQVFNVVRFICQNDEFTMITSDKEFYFEINGKSNVFKRSKGLKRDELLFIDDNEIIEMFVENFLGFQKTIK